MRMLAFNWLLAAPFGLSDWVYYPVLGLVLVGLCVLLFIMMKNRKEE